MACHRLAERELELAGSETEAERQRALESSSRSATLAAEVERLHGELAAARQQLGELRERQQLVQPQGGRGEDSVLVQPWGRGEDSA